MEDINNPLSRLANRARQKFNKKEKIEEKAVEKKKLNVEYIFKKFDDKSEQSIFTKKVSQILEMNPDVQDPIGKLIDENIYLKMTDYDKDRYILKLTNKYLNYFNAK